MRDLLGDLFYRGVQDRGQRLALEVKRAARLSGLRRVEPILFCHLPKCGGTSFKTILEKEYLPRQLLLLYKLEELNYPEPSREFIESFQRRRETVQIVYGHIKFGMHNFLNIPPRYVAILREPIDRVISLYDHYERDPASSIEWHERIKAGLSLKEFARLAGNHMTELLAGSYEPADEATLRQAKENISQYFVAVGTTDNMEAMLHVLSSRFSWRRHTIPTLNARMQPRAPIDEETRAVIADNNRLDAALYEWVKAKGVDEVSARATR